MDGVLASDVTTAEGNTVLVCVCIRREVSVLSELLDSTALSGTGCVRAWERPTVKFGGACDAAIIWLVISEVTSPEFAMLEAGLGLVSRSGELVRCVVTSAIDTDLVLDTAGLVWALIDAELVEETGRVRTRGRGLGATDSARDCGLELIILWRSNSRCTLSSSERPNLLSSSHCS